jgi:predicted nuclease with TOPRIM domain
MDYKETENDILREKLKDGTKQLEMIADMQEQVQEVISVFEEYLKESNDYFAKLNNRIDELERRILTLSK